MSKPQNPPVEARLQTRPRRSSIQVEVDGLPVSAFAGESVAAVLMVAGTRIFTQASRSNLARTIYCGMGVCHQCLVTVDGVRDVRACMTKIRPGMEIETRLVKDEAA